MKEVYPLHGEVTGSDGEFVSFVIAPEDEGVDPSVLNGTYTVDPGAFYKAELWSPDELRGAASWPPRYHGES